eukprot:GILJ01010245.1.p1 GENE.GILJ01010245.1~~GILJ01010245.1.p1  ORF type:complete len:871 (-),score=160.71 GILJ01010245.1:110-2722(-)
MASTTMTVAASHRTRNFFLGEGVYLQQHLDYLREDLNAYQTELLELVDNNITLSSAVKGRVYAALWITKNLCLLDRLQLLPNFFTVVEILKATKLLDVPRRLRAIQKRLVRLEAGGARKKTLAQWRQESNNLQPDTHNGTGASGAFCRRVKKWTASIPEERLEFFLMQYPSEPWQQLADIVHLSPCDFKAAWFLKAIFGEAVDVSPTVDAVRNLHIDNIVLLLQSMPRLADYYSTIRVKLSAEQLPEAAKLLLVRHMDLLEVIWWYHDLDIGDTSQMILRDRLAHGSLSTASARANYSKLMERLLFFREKKYLFADQLMPVVESKLEDMIVPASNMKSVVMGDASGSMQMAIRVAAIMGSLLSVYLQADLCFFSSRNIQPHVLPRTALEVVEVSERIKAAGSTCPAASLFPYYSSKQKVDLFVVVTDEEENGSFKGYRFAQLFKKYQEEVHRSAQVLLVSFVANNFKGQMRQELEDIGVHPLQFTLDKARPDLSKFDSILGILSNQLLSFRQEEVPLSSPSSLASQHLLSEAQVLDEPDIPASLDLVFCVDCTGSMGSYIQSAQDNIRRIVASIVDLEGCDFRFGLVCYRDHPPQDSSYVVNVCDFTNELSQMQANVNAMEANGGGDGPECVVDGLNAVLGMPWRADASKICIFIADAPPHGLPAASGDGFPAGCPCGLDPLQVLRNIAANEITLYSVCCEPDIGRVVCGRDFMVFAAEVTQGQAVALESATLLTDVILGGAQEEMALHRLKRDVQQVMGEMGAPTTADEDALVLHVMQRLKDNNVTAKRLVHDSVIEAPYKDLFFSSSSLAELRQAYAKGAAAQRMNKSKDSLTCKAASEVFVYEGELSEMQIRKVIRRLKAASNIVSL